MEILTLRNAAAAAIFLACVSFLGCDSAYYKTMEKFGYHKRDLLIKRVQAARDAQEEAKDQFESALERFGSVLNFDGGKLEEKYEQLKAEYDRSDSKAEAVRTRIDDVEGVAEALFAEWEAELGQYTNDRLRRSSETQLRETRSKYGQLIGAMKRAESKLDPVLFAFRDQVLFLKHNLNARAISSLQSELMGVEADVASLIKDMEASIREADTFIREMGQP